MSACRRIQAIRLARSWVFLTPANVMRAWCRKYGLREFLRPSGLARPDPKLIREAGSNGLGLDRKGRLIIADSGNRALVRYDIEKRTRVTLADRYQGKRFNSVNDVPGP